MMVENVKRESPRRGRGSSYRGAKPSKGLGLLFAVCLVVVLVFAFASGWVKLPKFEVPQVFGQASAPAASASEATLEKSYDAVFLDYVHPTLGFKVRYPAGYVVVSSNVDSSPLKLYAYGSGDLPVSVTFTVFNGSFIKQDFAGLVSQSTVTSALDDFDYSVLWNGTASFGRNTYYFANLSAVSKASGDGVIVSYAVINCPKYGVAVVSSVPRSNPAENKVVSAILESFECG